MEDKKEKEKFFFMSIRPAFHEAENFKSWMRTITKVWLSFVAFRQGQGSSTVKAPPSNTQAAPNPHPSQNLAIYSCHTLSHLVKA